MDFAARARASHALYYMYCRAHTTMMRHVDTATVTRRLRSVAGQLAACGPPPEPPPNHASAVAQGDRDRPYDRQYDRDRLGDTRIIKATPAGPGGDLSAAQLEAYCENGFLLVSGLIPSATLAEAESAMWAQMAAENRDTSASGEVLQPTLGMNQKNVPESWKGDYDWQAGENRAVMAVYTPEYVWVAQQLASAQAGSSLYPVVEQPKVAAPTSALSINRFPRWRGGWLNPDTEESPSRHGGLWPAAYEPHSDYGWKPESERHPADWRDTKQPVYIQHFAYLQSAGAPGGAGPLLWPGSHRALALEYVASQLGTRWLGPIEPDLDTNDEVGAPHNKVLIRVSKAAGLQPVEVVPLAGDVLFLNLLCGHCGVRNCSPVPRLAAAGTFEGR